MKYWKETTIGERLKCLIPVYGLLYAAHEGIRRQHAIISGAGQPDVIRRLKEWRGMSTVAFVATAVEGLGLWWMIR